MGEEAAKEKPKGMGEPVVLLEGKLTKDGLVFMTPERKKKTKEEEVRETVDALLEQKGVTRTPIVNKLLEEFITEQSAEKSGEEEGKEGKERKPDEDSTDST